MGSRHPGPDSRHYTPHNRKQTRFPQIARSFAPNGLTKPPAKQEAEPVNEKPTLRPRQPRPVQVENVYAWIEAAQACRLPLNRSLHLYRQLGGKVRTQEFSRAWLAEEERRSAWDGAA